MSWIATIAREVAESGSLVRVTVIRADGSTPREIGAAMRVSAQWVRDTIGGGALELEAITHARALLAAAAAMPSWRRDVRDFALGPSLGQCCGGFARLLFEVFTPSERPSLEALLRTTDADSALVLRPIESGAPLFAVMDRKDPGGGRPLAVTRVVRDVLSGARTREPALVSSGKGAPAWFIEPLARRTHPLYIYGAGHVGRALVRVLQDLPFAITWIDTAVARFPETIPAHASVQVAPDPTAAAAGAPAHALHIVLTYSHALDLAICHTLLRRDDLGFLGLIGSATKRARFRKRLAGLGIGEAQLARLTCPIGLPGLGGKEPAMIAVAVAAQLVQLVTSRRALATDDVGVAEGGAR